MHWAEQVLVETYKEDYWNDVDKLLLGTAVPKELLIYWEFDAECNQIFKTENILNRLESNSHLMH